MKTKTLTPVTWQFPLTRPHEGMLFGNATLGAMVWGGGDTLRVTLGRADLWDHQGGAEFRDDQTYANIRRVLESGDKPALDKLFEDRPVPGEPVVPTIVPIGRVEYRLGKGVTLAGGVLDLGTGCGTVTNTKGDVVAKIFLAPETSVLHIQWGKGIAPVAKSVPAWDSIRDELAARNFTVPECFENGWVQPLPKDPEVCCAYATAKNHSVLTATRPDKKRSARAVAESGLDAALAHTFAAARKNAAAWWAAYWARVPHITIPDATLTHLYEYGMYKLAGLTHPGGVAATLQGPWVEDYQLPPWSNDYHFNINVQMCYWPAYRAGLLDHLMPMFDMVLGWREQLARNAKTFLGIDDGIMLPHATTDTGRCIGCGFWTGMMDHGSTMWIAELMFRYVRYAGDVKFLRRAYPFMTGAMRVLEGMLETLPDGTLSLPVGVSPEYRGSQPDAWGRDPSFQLACAHRLAEDLLAAAEMLGEPPLPIAQKILDRLPKATLVHKANGVAQIALWQGLNLEESHRHHSHLAALVPFDTIDCEAPEWRDTVLHTFEHWLYRGSGLWSGWCVPWASMLHTRVGNADCAALWLDIWHKLFVNRGHGTRHDAAFSGFSMTGARAIADGAPDTREKMQMDAGMGAIAAIQEMLLHDKRGVNHLFKGVPQAWGDVSFDRLLAPDGVWVSAKRARAGSGTAVRVSFVTLTATRKTTFRLASPWTDEVLTIPLKKDETVTLRPTR